MELRPGAVFSLVWRGWAQDVQETAPPSDTRREGCPPRMSKNSARAATAVHRAPKLKSYLDCAME